LIPNLFLAFQVELQQPALWRELIANCPAVLTRLALADLHVTLAFLGKVARSAGVNALAQCPHVPAFSGRFDYLEAMGPGSRPSALVLIDTQADALRDYIAEVRGAALHAAGVEAEPLPVKPHCTLIRIPRTVSLAQRAAGLSWVQSTPVPNLAYRLAGPFLFASQADAQGHLYQRL